MHFLSISWLYRWRLWVPLPLKVEFKFQATLSLPHCSEQKELSFQRLASSWRSGHIILVHSGALLQKPISFHTTRQVEPIQEDTAMMQRWVPGIFLDIFLPGHDIVISALAAVITLLEIGFSTCLLPYLWRCFCLLYAGDKFICSSSSYVTTDHSREAEQLDLLCDDILNSVPFVVFNLRLPPLHFTLCRRF